MNIIRKKKPNNKAIIDECYKFKKINNSNIIVIIVILINN